MGMSRNEIRFRRKMMTSRRIESHKNYNDLYNKYHKGTVIRRAIKWAVIFIVALAAIFLIALAF